MPEIILQTEDRVCTLSPGLTRSGLYPIFQSAPRASPEALSIIGAQISSVTPGYTVVANTTIAPARKFSPMISDAFSNSERSGVQSALTGVGTATMINLASFSLVGSAVKSTVVFRMASPTSRVASIPFLYADTRLTSISKPITSTCLANSTAAGSPT